jgi:hypothetical protein
MKVLRERSTVKVLADVVARALLTVAGCDPYYVTSVNGLLAGVDRPEPFDKKFVGEWYGPTWERVVWKVDRLMETDSYFVTHFDDKGEKTFYTASVFEVADLKLMDLQEVPAEGRTVRTHLLMKADFRLAVEIRLGATPPDMAMKMAALGGGPLLRYKALTLQPQRNRFFLDHPGLIATEKTFDGEGKPTGLRLTASPKDLREFFKTHGANEGLWVEEEKAIKLEAKLNQGDR